MQQTNKKNTANKQSINSSQDIDLLIKNNKLLMEQLNKQYEEEYNDVVSSFEKQQAKQDEINNIWAKRAEEELNNSSLLRELEELVAKEEALGGEENEPKILSTEEKQLEELQRELEATEARANQFQNIEDSSPVLRIEDIQTEVNNNLATFQRIQDSTSKKQDAQKKNPQTVNTKCCTIF